MVKAVLEDLVVMAVVVRVMGQHNQSSSPLGIVERTQRQMGKWNHPYSNHCRRN